MESLCVCEWDTHTQLFPIKIAKSKITAGGIAVAGVSFIRDTSSGATPLCPDPQPTLFSISPKICFVAPGGGRNVCNLIYLVPFQNSAAVHLEWEGSPTECHEALLCHLDTPVRAATVKVLSPICQGPTGCRAERRDWRYCPPHGLTVKTP